MKVVDSTSSSDYTTAMHFIQSSVLIAMLVLLVASRSADAVLYVNDAETRRESTSEERKSFLFMRGTAFLIDSDIIVTAKHIATDGTFAVSKNQFVTIREILEESPEGSGDVDYKIARIEWSELRNEPRRGLYPISCPKGRVFLNRISPAENQYFAHSPERNPPVNMPFFALGYPKSTGVATTSSGTQLVFEPMGAESNAVRVRFNAGVVQGNSGGPILDLEGRLIGIVTGGPGYSEEPEHDAGNPDHFNWGLSAQSLYGISPTFKRILDEATASGKTSCK